VEQEKARQQAIAAGTLPNVPNVSLDARPVPCVGCASNA
jgi:hypothetical protein